jgi:predicted nucleic acid-binding protein
MLFDTDVIIWAFRGNSEAQHEINNAKPRQISIITYMELLQGHETSTSKSISSNS